MEMAAPAPPRSDGAPERTCPECGTGLLPSARFCHHCGWDRKNPAAGRAAAVTARTAYGRPAWKRRTAAAFVWFTLALLLFLGLRPGDGAAAEIGIGDQAPDFTLTDLSGQPLTLSDLRGRYVVLNFWATWCPPCRKEMPVLQQVHARYQEQGVVVVGVNLDESPLTIRAFTEPLGVTFPIVIDKGNKVTQAYGFLPLPTTYFIGPDGQVRLVQYGEVTEEQADALISQLLADQAPGRAD